MKKYLHLFTASITLFLIVAIIGTHLYAQKKYYSIQLASAKKNEKGLKYIESEVKKLSNNLRTKVRIVAGERFYMLYALKADTKQEAEKSLSKYRVLYKDALIRHHDPSSVKLIKDYSNKNIIKIEKVKTKKIEVSKKKEAPKKKEKNSYFKSDMFVGKTIFAMYLDRQREGVALITMNLNSDYTMNFEVAVGRNDSGLGKYFIDFQGRFYVYMNEADRYNAYYTLQKETKDYLLATAWENGIKDSNEIRFYYDFDKAMSYMNSLDTF